MSLLRWVYSSLSIPPIITVETPVPHLHELHDHNTRQMAINNYNYQSAAESHKWLQELVISYEVLIRVQPERFSLKTLKKLHIRLRSPYKVIEEVWFQCPRARYFSRSWDRLAFSVEAPTRYRTFMGPQLFPLHQFQPSRLIGH